LFLFIGEDSRSLITVLLRNLSFVVNLDSIGIN
jgi:hypothetical protein